MVCGARPLTKSAVDTLLAAVCGEDEGSDQQGMASVYFRGRRFLKQNDALSCATVVLYCSRYPLHRSSRGHAKPRCVLFVYFSPTFCLQLLWAVPSIPCSLAISAFRFCSCLEVCSARYISLVFVFRILRNDSGEECTVMLTRVPPDENTKRRVFQAGIELMFPASFCRR